MNKEKSDQYRNLVAKVKEKYKSYTTSNDKITLGWCDLLPDEDLCREINLWTYWQGWNYAEHTPIIKYMLLGQDFGPPDKEEQKGTIDNVRLLNEQGRAKKNVMFHDGVKMDARDSKTDKALIPLFEILGRPDIDKVAYDDLFFCICCLGYRKGNYSGNMTQDLMMSDEEYIRELVDIIEPENIICLGFNTSIATIRILCTKDFQCKNFSALMERKEPYVYKKSKIFPVAHPGYWGMKNRGGEDIVKSDWKRILDN